MPKYLDAQGNPHEATIEVTLYKEAADKGMSLPQLLAQKFPTDSKKYGTTFEQMLADQGMFLRANSEYGIKPATLADIFNGTGKLDAGTIVKDAAPASRILFPAVFLEAIENKLKTDFGQYAALFDKMIAISDSINGNRFEQPQLNYSNPEAALHSGISQLALPNSMLSITVSDVARKIPTFALGMEISYEAMQASTLDLVSLALARQAEIERASRIDGYIDALRQGDADMGTAALAVKNLTAVDPAAVAGTLTHKGWVKFLRTGWRLRHIDWVMCDLATALKIENRTGKPVITTDDPNSKRINPTADVVNPAWQNVNIFLLEDGVIPADIILGLDSRYAIRRVRNSQADYAAVEEFVLRKSRAMRFDFGEVVYRLFDGAWDVLNVNA
jgi:hypothetical protein